MTVLPLWFLLTLALIGAAGLSLFLFVVLVGLLDALRPSSPAVRLPAGEARETSPASRAPVTTARPLRLVDELDAVVIRLDDWRGGSAA